MFGLLRRKPRVIVLRNNTGNISYRNGIPVAAQTPTPTPSTSNTGGCGCGCNNKEAQCCPTSTPSQKNAQSLRMVQQMLREGNSSAIPKAGKLRIELENESTTDAQEVVLFDPDTLVQDHFNIPSFPSPVKRIDLDKDYQNFLNGISSRDTLFFCKVTLTVLKDESKAQTDNPFKIYVGHHLSDDVTKVAEYTPSDYQDLANQRNLSFTEMCMGEMLEPRTGIKYRLEAGAKVRICFEFASIIGSDR